MVSPRAHPATIHLLWTTSSHRNISSQRQSTEQPLQPRVMEDGHQVSLTTMSDTTTNMTRPQHTTISPFNAPDTTLLPSRQHFSLTAPLRLRRLTTPSRQLHIPLYHEIPKCARRLSLSVVYSRLLRQVVSTRASDRNHACWWTSANPGHETNCEIKHREARPSVDTWVAKFDHMVYFTDVDDD